MVQKFHQVGKTAKHKVSRKQSTKKKAFEQLEKKELKKLLQNKSFFIKKKPYLAKVTTQFRLQFSI